MALRLERQYRFRKRIRRGTPQATSPTSTALVTAAVEATPVLTLTFDQPVILQGVPLTWVTVGLVPNLNPISAVQTASNEIELTFGASIAAATGITLTPNDPAVRTPTGGFAAAPTFPV